MAIPVLTLSGGTTFGRGRLPDNFLGGELFSGDYERDDVLYPTTPSKSNAEAGAEELDKALHSISGKRLVVGHSMGTQVWNMWLRTYGTTHPVDPEDVVFVGGGNLESKFGGGANVEGAKALGLLRIKADYGGCGFPDSTPYRTVTISRQYDNFGHHPTDINNKAAVRNAWAGFFVHLDYRKVSLSDPLNAVYGDPACPNATYMLAPTYPLPSAPWWYSRSSKEKYDAKHRKGINAAYDLPYMFPLGKGPSLPWRPFR